MVSQKWFAVSAKGLMSACAIGLCTLNGCGGAADVAPATGVITMGGQPVEEAKVMFHPIGGGSRNSYGTTNAQGEFKVSTYGRNDGALVGRHVVTITKVDTKDQVKFDAAELAQKGYGGAGYEKMMGPKAAANAEKNLSYIIPAKYSSKDTSGIEVDVVKGETNHFPLDLDAPAGK